MSLNEAPQAGRLEPALDERERVLFTRYQRDGDLAAREELVRRFLPLAARLARRYQRANEPLEDLVQVASVALLKAIDRYDNDHGASFSSYAVPTILGELKRHFRDCGWALHVPRRMQEGLLTLNQAMERLSAQLGHSPSPQQLASELGVTVEDVLEAVEAGAAYNTIPLDTPLRSQDGEALTVAGSLGHNDDRFEVVEDRAAVERALRALPARERSIIYLHFAESLTQVEIAKRAGISQMHVSRLIRRALETMRVVVAGPQSDVDL